LPINFLQRFSSRAGTRSLFHINARPLRDECIPYVACRDEDWRFSLRNAVFAGVNLTH
jgi:hypothetical protein